VSRTKCFCSLKFKVIGPQNFWLATQLLVTTFVQTTCISLAPSHVPQHQAVHTTLPYLMYNLPLTKSSQQRKTARYCSLYRTVARKSSVGGLTFKFDKNSTDSLCFKFLFGGLGTLFGGAKPTKAPRVDGTESVILR